MLSHYEGPFYPLGRGAWATAARESSGWAAHASGIRTLTLTLTLTLILTLTLTLTLTPILTRNPNQAHASGIRTLTLTLT